MADHFVLDRSTVSRQVGALERLGYLTREVDPENRRNHILRPTAQGRRVVGAVEQRRHREFAERSTAREDADIRRFAEYLVRYNAGK